MSNKRTRKTKLEIIMKIIIMFNNNIKKLYEKSKLERIGRTI